MADGFELATGLGRNIAPRRQYDQGKVGPGRLGREHAGQLPVFVGEDASCVTIAAAAAARHLRADVVE